MSSHSLQAAEKNPELIICLYTAMFVRGARNFDEIDLLHLHP